MSGQVPDLLTRFLDHVRSRRLFHSDNLLFLAVSGGLDSIVLTDLVHRAGFRFVILHVNFQLRGAESDRDEEFVQQLGSRYGAPVMSRKVDTNDYAKTHKISIQEAARAIRYQWFREFLVPGIDGKRKYVLTAHHVDDNVETLLQHFFQGSGIAGLHGIPEHNDGMVRPLLFARRSDLEAYANEQGLKWVEDSSNTTVKYTRNAIRLEILPAIEKVFPQVRENLMDNLYRFKEIEVLYRQGLERQLKKLLVATESGWKVPVERLRRTEPLRTICFELFTRFGFSTAQVSGIIDLLDSPTGRYMDSSTHRLLRDRAWLLVAPLATPDSGVRLIEKGQPSLLVPGGEIQVSLDIKTGDQHVPKEPMLACVDAAQVRFPLLVRRWRPGDYFYPLGMSKKQKVARFLISAKVDRLAKEKVLVVESDKRILWIVGHRIDDRFKVGAHTKQRLTLQYFPD